MVSTFHSGNEILGLTIRMKGVEQNLHEVSFLFCSARWLQPFKPVNEILVFGRSNERY